MYIAPKAKTLYLSCLNKAACIVLAVLLLPRHITYYLVDFLLLCYVRSCGDASVIAIR